jgi:uncharacterized SAM-binding protein YcdF (DUF218 family)
MWIQLSKILPYLVFPLSIFFECLVIGWLCKRFGAIKFGNVFQGLGVIVLLVASMPPVAIAFNQRLESWYQPMPAAKAPRADAIILLGGALSLPLTPRIGPELTDASDRILYAAQLYKAGRAPLILVTGGNVFKQDEKVESEAYYISKLLQQWGIPESAILIETESRNTRQNALNSAKILDQNTVKSALLVTSAFHMPRAAATFKAVGLNVVPSPIDFAVVNYKRPVLLDYLPSAGALGGTTRALREHVGIFVYGLRGWLKSA